MRPTPEQRAASRAEARQRCELVDGTWIATHLPVSSHGKPYVADYYGCDCAPCAASVVRNRPSRRAELRREHLARRSLIAGLLVAAHLPGGQHGTPSASDYYGCQCGTCTDAAAERRARRGR